MVMQVRGNGAPDGQCVAYAKYLQDGLNFPTKRITWTATCNEPVPKTVRHQVLSYTVGKEVWFVSNDWPDPRWVGNEGDSWEQLIKQWYTPSWVTVSGIVVE